MRLSVLLTGLAAASSPAQEAVRVALDMDVSTPGVQGSVLVEPGAAEVAVDVYVYDPEGARRVWEIGYLGGINRGIALGHAPSAHNIGRVESIRGHALTPVNPGNVGFVDPDGWVEKSFEGPEVQYTEGGARSDAPIASAPNHPVFRATVALSGAAPGDAYAIAIADNVVLWSGGEHGAFSTVSAQSLDTGGDAVPDATPTVHGPDADDAIEVPPGAYPVDFIDGGASPAFVLVRCAADFNGDGRVDTLDVLAFLNAWSRGEPEADWNHDGAIDTRDVLAFLHDWSAVC